jgi:putative acetyltransferase
MNTPFIIRPEIASDALAISAVIDAAFKGMPYAEGDEAELLHELRRQSALSVSLVAEQNGQVIGQVAFSPAYATNNSNGWYSLGPIAVLPAHQGTGVGSALMREGLAALQHLNAQGCILVGHPQLYAKFGFIHAPDNAPADEPPEYFMLKQFHGATPSGAFAFHAAFKHDPGWVAAQQG